MTNREKYQAGEVSGIRVIFPTTKEAMREALKAIGVDGIRCREVFLTEHDSNLSGFCHCISQGDSVDELNYLCRLLSDMTASRNQRKRTKTHSDITIRFSQSV
ncbi:hypothetical protein BACCAP_04327 [Pseudoflavonifractor capillosus ATCC 29799]|uniref:Uncharacterized protein n=1 Tax=Pseudoflavonifractor capillosus ATCC 29799 TaxID=411467 RepID=A6P1G0_9FIRM|nr:antirestriction protein ArdA [Pseudoflavonifractor capillosus]EDM97852.1 hypothetical protein BACCAP_04327 [Pseudoflavonifractor capillosus ATCC 29799]